jgi:AcrR family transcriptional regulator
MQQRSIETRTRILDAALEQFAKKGYNEASIDDICTEAGISKGAFYHHFPSKKDAFLMLLNEWLQIIDVGLEAARQSTVPDTLVYMTRMLPGIITTAGQQLPLLLEFWLQASRDDKVREATISPYHRYQQYFAILVQEGIKEGSFQNVDPQATAQMIVSLAVGLLLQGLLEQDKTNWQLSAEQSMRILMNGLVKNKSWREI